MRSSESARSFLDEAPVFIASTGIPFIAVGAVALLKNLSGGQMEFADAMLGIVALEAFFIAIPVGMLGEIACKKLRARKESRKNTRR